MSKRTLFILSQIWLVPLALVILCGYLAWQVIDKQSNWIETTGTVIHVYEWTNDSPFDSAPHVYGPVFRYVWSDGNETDASTGMSSSDYNFPVGTTMRIRYDRLTRGDVVIVGPGEWMMVRTVALLLGIVSLLALIATVVLVIRAKRRNAS